MQMLSKVLRNELAMLAWLFLFLFPLGMQAANTQPTPVRDADAACAHCHAKMYESYLTTPMANASGIAMEQLRAGEFVHSRSGTEYSISARGDHGELSYRSLEGTSNESKVQLDYFLGSGHLGTTYLYREGAFLFESPVAWYAPSASYDMKPGLAQVDQMPPPLPMESSCLRCHMSAVQQSDPGTIDRYSGLPFLHGGITCEACHGDTAQHLATNGRTAVVNPAKLNADLRDSVCISCHLEGDVSVERAGRSALDYRPGESISTYLAFYVRTGAKLTDRSVSEVEQLSQSVCKRSSGERMSCVSCHDPHSVPDAANQAAYFRGRCLACHSQPEFASTHHPENRDCISCHMPRMGARNVLHVAWTDHRIRKLPDPGDAQPQAGSGGKLSPVFSSTATERDQAMANYQAVLDGDRSLEPMAWVQLTALRSNLENDKDALDAFGNMSAERGERDQAERAFRRVLEIDPSDLTALSNLGILFAKEGKLKEGEAYLQKAFDRNQDLPGLAMNLARVQCMRGDGKMSRATLTEALIYSPNLEDLRHLMAEISNCSGAGDN